MSMPKLFKYLSTLLATTATRLPLRSDSRLGIIHSSGSSFCQALDAAIDALVWAGSTGAQPTCRAHNWGMDVVRWERTRFFKGDVAVRTSGPHEV
jgi:hypothetical protein